MEDGKVDVENDNNSYEHTHTIQYCVGKICDTVTDTDMARKQKKGGFWGFLRTWRNTHEESGIGVVIGVIFLLTALFLLFASFWQGGSWGAVVRTWIFSLAGWGYLLLIPILLFASYQHLARVRHVSFLRFWSGSALCFLCTTVFLTASFSETAGGLLGVLLLSQLLSYLGSFTYLLLPFLFILAFTTMGLFSPTHAWERLTAYLRGDDMRRDKNDDEDEEYDEGDEEYDEEEDEEEENEGDEEYDEEGEEYDEEGEEYDEEDEESEEYEEDEDEKEEAMPREKHYTVPPLSLLQGERGRGRAGDTRVNADAIKRTLQNFKVAIEVEEVVVGPTFTRYSVKPAEGVRLSKIVGLQSNLELALAAHPVRIEAPIPGKALVGIEVPNTTRATVGLRTLLESNEYVKNTNMLPIAIGKTITGEVLVQGLAKMPHLLIAGTTGSGKSVLIHNLVLSILFAYGPRDVRFIFIDPKRVELTQYGGIAHLLTEPITDPKKALQALSWTVGEMEKRYELLGESGTRDIASYHKKMRGQKDATPMPYIVVVIDELADLMQSYPREIESSIVRIAQKSRAVGIHLVLSTQRPSVNVITGVVKANVPVRIGLQVASQIDSRTILDATGAENLIGRGDLLFASAEYKKAIRAQAAFSTEEEVQKVVQFLIKNSGVAEGMIDLSSKPGGDSGGFSQDDDDTLYEEAKDIVVSMQKASTSLLQRKLRIGYSRAARILDILEERGVVGTQFGSKPREVLVDRTDEDGEV